MMMEVNKTKLDEQQIWFWIMVITFSLITIIEIEDFIVWFR